MIGIVKEVLTPDQGLGRFHAQFFDFPIYCDSTYSIYNVMGSRSIGFAQMLNKGFIKHMLCESFKPRKGEATAESSDPSEGLLLGGILVLDKMGNAQAMYQERAGEGIPVRDLVDALQISRTKNGRKRDAR